MNIIYKTVSGSRLYGLAHADSDYDYYTVVDKPRTKKARYIKHSIVDGIDSTYVDFGTWVNLCQAGIPTALEAMFSQQAMVDDIADFRADFVAGTNFDAYLGVMKHMRHEHPDSYKHKRHLIRLGKNMRDIRAYGRFDPTLSAEDIELVNELAKLPMEHVYNDALAIAWS